MDELIDIKCERDHLFHKAMDNQLFVQIFYGHLDGDEDEVALKNKLILLNKVIDDFQGDTCGCGQGIRIQAMKSLIKEIKTYI